MDKRALSPLFVFLLALVPSPAGAGVERTVHNLAATGGGILKSGEAAGVCVFCHTPHNAEPTRALWNRELPGVTYKLYESSTLEAILNQPTGSSRLCLSCHDGTIALGDLRMKPKGVKVSLGPLRGKASLGTDLSDDHPISFVYDARLTLPNGELIDPALLPQRLRLDTTKQLQCTTCHDPHEDKYPKFLVMENRFAQLCVTCHQMRGWPGSVHATSAATSKGIGQKPWPGKSLETVAENACMNCHRVHAAGPPQWLLNFAEEERNCFVCHNRAVASKDVEQDFRKFSAHPVEETEWVHNPREEPFVMRRHVTCTDCHNPHAVESAKGRPSFLTGAIRGVKGVNASGAKVAEANFEYEVCYACHGVTEQPRAVTFRQDHVTNVRVEFDPGNPSYHPVVTMGKNAEVPSLEAGYTPSSLITCTDCHNSDSSTFAGRPRGPHGSTYEPILEREYQVGDPSPESFQAYALCYKCHNRTLLLADQSGFPHRRHVVEAQASCAVCHDAHGSRRNTHLINFMDRGKTGGRVVFPSSSRRLEFQDLGRFTGRCFLSCHGMDHDPKGY